MQLKPKLERACQGCKKCCEGWLTGKAYGQPFSPTRPCTFLGVAGCKIYPNRPYDPCQTFLCEWRRDQRLPDWIKPDRSGRIFVARVLAGHQYMLAVATERVMDPRIPGWAADTARDHGINFLINHDSQWHVYSKDTEFVIEVQKLYSFARVADLGQP
jgi:Fe-S-cluster containining protein